METRGQWVSNSPLHRLASQPINWNLMLPFYFCEKKKRKKPSSYLKGICVSIWLCTCMHLYTSEICLSVLLIFARVDWLNFNLWHFAVLSTEGSSEFQKSCWYFCDESGGASLAEACDGGRICFMRVIDAGAAGEDGKAGMKLCRGSDPYRSIRESWGRTTVPGSPGRLGLGPRSALRYS